ncbi:hypothetical protein [Deinococcus planocerae]|uniref:hypothetical protein n=1 Tax=Deinococcus planocerae TaxID=1737569 RepID=UPI000C7F3879|nr:hypothetical protein [Deinococcus planocerae]
MTDPLTQAQADAEQVRLVREALARRRASPAGEASPPVLRFFPGGPRPTLAEAGGVPQGAPVPSVTTRPEPRELGLAVLQLGEGRGGPATDVPLTLR